MSVSVAPQSAAMEVQVGLQLERRHLRVLGIFFGLALILIGNHVVRRHLEHTHLPPYPIFPDDRVPITWRLLLPVDIGAPANAIHPPGSYHWFTTGLTIVKLLERVFTPNTVFYTLNLLLIICSFACTWQMFRSSVFSFTVTICMAFGTQFHWVYICSPIQAFYLYVMFVEINLLCLYKLLNTGERRWQIGYPASLVLLALNHEQWLDYLVFLGTATGFLWLYARRAPAPALKPRLIYVAMCTALIAAAYLTIRLPYGQHQARPGHESEMVFTYGSPVLAIEDWLSNVLTYLYLAVSNYFPPCLVSSNSLYLLGAQEILAEQKGYHADQSHLVAMHHVFYWYFFAGIVATVFGYFLVRNFRAALAGSPRHAVFTLCMFMVVAGFGLHSLIKYRPYMSVPLLTYKCMTSNVGMAYLIAYCLMDARRWPGFRRLAPVLVVLVWSVIAYGALARPAYLSHLSETVGMSKLPDPMRTLWGGTE